MSNVRVKIVDHKEFMYSGRAGDTPIATASVDLALHLQCNHCAAMTDIPMKLVEAEALQERLADAIDVVTRRH